jgi:hypothetical protein
MPKIFSQQNGVAEEESVGAISKMEIGVNPLP